MVYKFLINLKFLHFLQLPIFFFYEYVSIEKRGKMTEELTFIKGDEQIQIQPSDQIKDEYKI